MIGPPSTSPARKVWYRAVVLSEHPAPQRGDRHLAALQFVGGMAYKGGFSYAVDVCDSTALRAGAQAAEYFGLAELADIIGKATWLKAVLEAMDDDTREVTDREMAEAAAGCGSVSDLNAAYNAVVTNEIVMAALEAKLRSAPEDFAPG